MPGVKFKRVRGVYGQPWSRMSSVPITREVLDKLGKCLVDTIVKEARRDFAKRGWSMKDPMGGPPLDESFDYRIRGSSTVEITSSFYGMAELASGDIPRRRMTWLTQEAKETRPTEFKLTKREKQLGMKQTGRPSEGGRLPLVIPLKSAGGAVVFRMAPLTTNDAWIHPGISKFTFLERGIRKGREKCAEILGAEVVKHLLQGDPTR